MGDSFTEGVGVPYEQTFVGIVETSLAQRGIEVLNGAVSFYCPTIYYRKTRYLLEDAGLQFDQMAVFIDISDIDDEIAFTLDASGNVALDEQRRRAERRANWRYNTGFWRLRRLQRFLDQHTLLLGRILSRVDGLFARSGHRAAAWTSDRQAYEAFGREGLERARAHMDLLQELLRSRGIRLTIVVYPWTDQILAGERDSLQQRFWSDWASTRGAGFIDLFPDFLGTGPPREAVRRYFIAGDVHWNAAGHRLVAESFLKRYDARPRPARLGAAPSR
jgi:hypothetical protein